MDKYHCKFDIAQGKDTANWVLTDHTGKIITCGLGYKNWHNAMRALDRHIKVIQSGNFILPTKPPRKPYTFKSHVQQN